MPEFRVASAENRRAQARRGSLEAASLAKLAALLPPGRFATIAEIGSGSCSLAEHFFSSAAPAHFRAFESDPNLCRHIPAPRAAGPGQFSASLCDPATGIGLPGASQDLLLTCHYFEYLRMDELYMVAHEARRVVKPGGCWAVAGLALPANALQALWIRMRHPGQPLDLNHYISPEDWAVKSELRYRAGGLPGQLVLLERLTS